MPAPKDWLEIQGTERWAPAAMAIEAETTYLEIKNAIGPQVEWSMALPLIDDWATRQYPHSYCGALVSFRDKVRAGEWPNKDGCPKCLGMTCLACDFAGSRSGYEAMQRMEKEAYEAWDAMDAERAEYRARGICSRCRAKNPDEATKLCKPTYGESGEYWCPAEDLWQESRNA